MLEASAGGGGLEEGRKWLVPGGSGPCKGRWSRSPGLASLHSAWPTGRGGGKKRGLPKG